MADKAAEPKAEEQHILSLDEMLGADDVEYAVIPTWKTRDPETGEMVQGYTRVRSLSAEAIAVWRDTNDGPAKRTAGIRLFVDSLVDKDGTPIGTEKHYEAFKKKSNAIMEEVLKHIVKLNGLTVKQDADAKKP